MIPCEEILRTKDVYGPGKGFHTQALNTQKCKHVRTVVLLAVGAPACCKFSNCARSHLKCCPTLYFFRKDGVANMVTFQESEPKLWAWKVLLLSVHVWIFPWSREKVSGWAQDRGAGSSLIIDIAEFFGGRAKGAVSSPMHYLRSSFYYMKPPFEYWDLNGVLSRELFSPTHPFTLGHFTDQGLCLERESLGTPIKNLQEIQKKDLSTY